MRTAPLLAVALLVGGLGNVARATDCAPTLPVSAELSRIDAETRLAFIEKRLDAAARASRIWTGAWAGIYTALTAGSFALVAVVEPRARVDYYFSAGTSMVGLLSLGLSPLKSMRDASWLKRRPRGDVCALVADAERLLARDATSEANCRKMWLHVANVALNFGSLLVLGLVFDRWDAAALQGVAGTLIGEVMIVSTPTIAMDSLEDYRAGRLGPGKPPPLRAFAAAPIVLGPGGGGVAFGGRF